MLKAHAQFEFVINEITTTKTTTITLIVTTIMYNKSNRLIEALKLAKLILKLVSYFNYKYASIYV